MVRLEQDAHGSRIVDNIIVVLHDAQRRRSRVAVRQRRQRRRACLSGQASHRFPNRKRWFLDQRFIDEGVRGGRIERNESARDAPR